MSKLGYSLILVLALSVAACGVRRDLSVPGHDKHGEDADESHVSAPTGSID